jgi:DNA-binding transcriptional ArsR family regulator
LSAAEPAADPLSLALSAAAHPIRRRLMASLQAGPRQVTELAASFEVSLPAISRHLKVLEEAGLVGRTIVGRTHLIHARSEPVDLIASWAERQQTDWDARLGKLKSIMEEEG